MNELMYVYVFKVGSVYKIGIATNVQERMYGVKHDTGSSKIELIRQFFVRDARSLEWTLHKTFGAKKVTGEWFLLDNNDLATIDSICQHEIVGTIRDTTKKVKFSRVKRKEYDWLALEYPMTDGAGQYFWIGLIGIDEKLILPPEPYQQEIVKEITRNGFTLASHK